MACRYNVRMAVVDLDSPPAWWHTQAKDHMTAPEARALAGSNGKSGRYCNRLQEASQSRISHATVGHALTQHFQWCP